MNKIIHKPTRTLSGVTPITILTKPYPCPGKCAFCPTEKDMPKSYLSKEPAAARAKASGFSPAKQINYRLQQYFDNNHPTDKIELIILGGTWSYYPKRYQTWFIKCCFDTLNKKKSNTLIKAQEFNEKSIHRIIGITIETRPDYIDLKEIKRLRKLGITRVELGVQTVYEDVLQKNLRGHTISATIKATKLLKEAGLKINYHMMPNLPGSSKNRDIKMFDTLFNDSNFQPDMLKVYPCVLLKNTLAYKWYQQNQYFPYTNKELMEIGIKIKTQIPPYVRIMRFYRDIPKEYILAGSINSNIRELLEKEMVRRDIQCQCIRCREIRNEIQKKNLELKVIKYKASEGTEIFLEYVDSQDRIYGFLRLRINEPKSKLAFKCLSNTAIIRELHIYGQSTPINNKGKVQHRGLGTKLISEAERIAKMECKLSQIAVISGIGVREYYRKFGYKLQDTYMLKRL